MSVPSTMKGVQLTGHGGPEKLVWNDAIPTPQPGPGEALVRVLAAGVNNTDINTRIGWYAKEVTESTDTVNPDDEIEAGGWSGALSFPLIQGGDLCGEVVALGDGVTNVAPGMRVTCPTNQPNPTESAPTRFLAIGSEFDGAFAQFCLVPAVQLHDVSASPLEDVEIAAGHVGIIKQHPVTERAHALGEIEGDHRLADPALAGKHRQQARRRFVGDRTGR